MITNAMKRLYASGGSNIRIACLSFRCAAWADDVHLCQGFEDMVARERGASKALVTSATKLTAAQLTSLKTNLKKSLGKSVEIETAIDPDLLGGFVVQIGSRLFDSSLKTKLEGIKLAMKEV